MPYRIEYPTDDTPYLTISLSDPLPDAELKALREELLPMATAEQTSYILADLRGFDLVTSFQRLLLATDGIPLPSLTGSVGQSRLAVVGGGAALPLIMQVMGSLGETANMFKTFNTVDKAKAWLLAEQQEVM
jgi:hypothetical protein